MLTNPKFWLLAAVALPAIAFLALKAISLTGKKPSRPESPAVLPPCGESPNCVCSEDPREAYHIAPLSYEGAAEEAWARLKSVLQSLGGEQVTADGQYLWFEFRTPIIRFTDDVECRLDTASGQIEIRSASRAGHSDLGANRKRVEKIREAFNVDQSPRN